MKVLVLAENYPDNNGGVSLMYIHTRNLYYAVNGIDVTVLNFRTSTEYYYQGIRVISQKEYACEKQSYDLLILHAPNIKNHYRFIKVHGDDFPVFLFFFHGHEVLQINKVYSKPYPYVRVNKTRKLLQDVYDTCKLGIWRRYLPRVAEKSRYVFVSKWMFDEFRKWTRISDKVLKGKSSITYNCVGEDFEKNQYVANCEKAYDFVTIRGNLDGSKYAIDIVNRLAKNTPNRRFLVVGKGSFFAYNEKASNLEWRDQTMSHDEIIDTLNSARYALMPTRTDAQGLMMCEMAAFGIPVITSDIPVCHEVFDGFENVTFIDNQDLKLSLEDIAVRKSKCCKDTRYYKNSTVNQELELILTLLKKDNRENGIIM